MQCYVLKNPGTLNDIVVHECGMPEVGPTDILVRVRAASINKRDLHILEGTYPLPPRCGVIPLSDGAGEVVAVGERVARFRAGDRVAGNYFARWKSGPLDIDVSDQLGCTIDGMLTQFAVLDHEWAVSIPNHLSWEEAATLPCAGVTAWNCINGPVPVTSGQTVLTIGSGGVSTLAVQFAKAAGARVIAITSSAGKAAGLRALGAEVVIDRTEDVEWGKRVREATGGTGVDIVVETFGPDTIEQSMRAVGLHGQIMLLAARGAHRQDIRISAQAYAATMATIRRVS